MASLWSVAGDQDRRSAYIRGRLSDAFVVLDEAQNTTPEQMKCFLTRLVSIRSS